MGFCSINHPRRCLDKHIYLCSWKIRNLHTKSTLRSPYIAASWNVTLSFQCLTHGVQTRREHCMQRMSCRAFALPVNLKQKILQSQPESCSSHDEESIGSSNKLHDPPPKSSELKSLLSDSERAKLIRKLSEANQHNRFMKRQLHENEDALAKFKNELAIMGLEIQALIKLSEEICRGGISDGSRKINGKYIQSHLHSRLQAVSEKLKDQIKDVNVAQSKEVSVFWYGMAESVKVLGSFDGWNEGEQLSPEYSDFYTKFSTSLWLRPGRYEIKFLVDGAWRLSHEFPIIGEGAMQNNLLILHENEDALANFKNELAIMGLEIQALIKLSEEICRGGISDGSRKINGKYIQSHLHSRLQAVSEKLKDQIKDVNVAQSKEVSVFWYGMAESVKVLGSFDGWNEGEQLSPEYSDFYTKFSTSLWLRPGRYEIKFLVDGAWRLSHEFPIIGEGAMQNNLLIVE